jgi:hypothetical protein
MKRSPGRDTRTLAIMPRCHKNITRDRGCMCWPVTGLHMTSRFRSQPATFGCRSLHTHEFAGSQMQIAINLLSSWQRMSFGRVPSSTGLLSNLPKSLSHLRGRLNHFSASLLQPGPARLRILGFCRRPLSVSSN